MLGNAPYEPAILEYACHCAVEIFLVQVIVCLVQHELARDIAGDSAESRSQIDGVPGKVGYSATELIDIALDDVLASSHTGLGEEAVQWLTASFVGVMRRGATRVLAKDNRSGMVSKTDQMIAPSAENPLYVHAYLSQRPSWQYSFSK